MRLKIIFLLRQIFLNLSQIHQFRWIFVSGSQRLIDILLKFQRLSFMLSDQVFFYFLGFLLVLGHFLIPETVEFGNFLDMGHFDLLFLLLMFGEHLLSFVFFEISSHFG